MFLPLLLFISFCPKSCSLGNQVDDLPSTKRPSLWQPRADQGPCLRLTGQGLGLWAPARVRAWAKPPGNVSI